MVTLVTPVNHGQRPENAMATAYYIMNAALRDDLLALLQTMHPVRFERLILDLFAATNGPQRRSPSLRWPTRFLKSQMTARTGIALEEQK
jgi:hypothetical protein